MEIGWLCHSHDFLEDIYCCVATNRMFNMPFHLFGKHCSVHSWCTCADVRRHRLLVVEVLRTQGETNEGMGIARESCRSY